MQDDSSFTYYSRGVLENWETGKVGNFFMYTYLFKKRDEEKNSNLGKLEKQLEIICDILRDRSFEEREIVYVEIRTQMKLCVIREDFRLAGFYRDMMKHWDRTIEQFADV